MKTTFFWMKNTLFCPQFYTQNAGNRILGFWNFKRDILAKHAHRLPKKKRANRPLLIQSDTLFKPAGFFNFYWNPCIFKYILSRLIVLVRAGWVVGCVWWSVWREIFSYTCLSNCLFVKSWNLSSETFISNILSNKVLLITSFQPGDLSKVS